MEALAKGLPVFLSDIPVYKEIYKKNAFYFKATARGSSDFIDACEIYNRMNLDKRMLLSGEGINYASTVANSERYIDALLHIYNIEEDK